VKLRSRDEQTRQVNNAFELGKEAGRREMRAQIVELLGISELIDNALEQRSSETSN
jgi:hypothetical protein